MSGVLLAFGRSRARGQCECCSDRSEDFPATFGARAYPDYGKPGRQEAGLQLLSAPAIRRLSRYSECRHSDMGARQTASVQPMLVLDESDCH
jgi:hypothetical protein